MRKGTLHFFLLCFTYFNSADSISQIVVAPGRQRTVESVLVEDGVMLNDSSLIAAVKDTNGSSRAMAALELSRKHVVGAISSIEDAFEHSTDSVERFNFADALAGLSIAAGRAGFMEICHSTSDNTGVRLRSVERLRQLGSRDCDNAIVGILKDAVDPSIKISALGLISNSTQPDLERKETHGLEKAMLSDSNPDVRLAAARALCNADPASATPLLKMQTRRESDINQREKLGRGCSSYI